MTFTGNLIENLMASVERAEQRAQSDVPANLEALYLESLAVETTQCATPFVETAVETWFASVPEISPYDSKFLGVA